MKASNTLLVAACAAGIVGAVHESRGETDARDAPPQDFSGLDSVALIAELCKPDATSSAYYELWRRANQNDKLGYASFVEGHYDPEVVICPQPGDAPPLYVVLSGFLQRFKSSRDGEYKIENPGELFPRDPNDKQGRFWTKPRIEVFAHDATSLAPFEGNNVLGENGMMADINGDGFVERVDHTSYGLDGIRHTDVLHVSVVERKARPILAVLYNLGAGEWSYELTDADKDGIFDIELGPKTGIRIKTKVTYRWNSDTKSWDGPKGEEGDHFRVIGTENVWEELERIKNQGVRFSADPDFVDIFPRDRSPWARRGLKKPTPLEVSRPYHYRSLKDLSNEDLLRHMGDGKNMFDLEWDTAIRTHVPEDYWNIDPKSAALAMAHTNRYPDHQTRYRLAIDDRDGGGPPEKCSIAFSYASDRSYNAFDSHYFLRVDPEESWLLYARSWQGGVVFHNMVHDSPAFDLRRCALSYDEARHIAHTIWWLDRVRSISKRPAGERDAHSSGTGSSTADGRGWFAFRPETDGAPVEMIATSIWALPLPDTWGGEYSRTVFLNLATFLLMDVLPARLGEAWSSQEPAYPHDILYRQTSAPRYAADEKSRLIELTGQFLDLFTPDQARTSFAITAEAARAAAELTCPHLKPRLLEIHGALSAGDEPKPSAASIMPVPDASGFHGASRLSSTVALSLKKLEAADDVALLRSWACSRDHGWQWALQRLGPLDKSAYLASLEWWLENTSDDRLRQVYDEIAKVDARRAAEIATTLPAARRNALAVSAFVQLDKIDAVFNNIPDEARRVQVLIDVMLDPKSGWKESGRAIETLVPRDNPLRYPGENIDTALLALLELNQENDTLHFTCRSACRALARRGRTQWFDQMASVTKAPPGSYAYDGILEALTHLAQADPDRLNPKLSRIIEPHLASTNINMKQVLWAIWSADLREHKPRLEQLATSGPDDYEDPKAASSGGKATPVEGRFHLARIIVALWNEEDPATKAKLLVALGNKEPHHFTGENACPERRHRMRLELKQVAERLSPEAREEVRVFLQWCDSRTGGGDVLASDMEIEETTFNEVAREITGL